MLAKIELPSDYQPEGVDIVVSVDVEDDAHRQLAWLRFHYSDEEIRQVALRYLRSYQTIDEEEDRWIQDSILVWSHDIDFITILHFGFAVEELLVDFFETM
jgi:hypothetical protein